jgi:NACHT domain
VGERNGDGVAAFRAEGGALPPLTERIEPGAAGADEFRRLMHHLLRVHADRNGFAYTPAENLSGGIDGLARGGITGLEGVVAFQFKWLWDDLHKGNKAEQIRDSLARASIKGIKHWILVTPLDLQPFERDWLRRLQGQRGFTAHHWGQTMIEQLLRQCPPLLVRYFPSAAVLPGYNGPSFDELARSYREKVAIAHGHLKTIGLPPETLRQRDNRTDLRLRDLFIPLRLVPETAGKKLEDLASVLAANRSAVVLGDPGMGKSTLLAYLCLLFSGGASLPGFSPPASAIPLFISLRDYVRVQKAQPDLSFLAYLETRARERLQLPQAHRVFFEASLRMGEAVVLFDGLDEVGSEAARDRVATAIRTFRADFPDCPFWITSRIYGYTSNIRLPDAAFAHYGIGRLDNDQVNGFIERWYAIQIPDDLKDASVRATSLRQAVHRTPRASIGLISE